MAKTPSLLSEIEKAHVTALGERKAETRLLEQISAMVAAGDVPQADAVEVARQAVDALIEQKEQAEKALATMVLRLSNVIDQAYEDFNAANVRSRYENFLGFFSKNKAARHQALRSRKVTAGDTLKRILLNADAVADILAQEKTASAALQQKCEPPLVGLIQRRRTLAASIEAGRQRLKELNASLATVQWKLGSVTDEARRNAIETDRETLSLDLETQEGAYRALRSAHDLLDSAILLLEDLAQVVLLQLSAHSLLYNKLSAEMERAIQLYGAVSTSLEALMLELAKPDASSHAHLIALLTIHLRNSISLDDIERRKGQIDDAFLRRYSPEKGRVTAITKQA